MSVTGEEMLREGWWPPGPTSSGPGGLMLIMETGPVIFGAAGAKPSSCRVKAYWALVKCPALALINPEPREWLVLLLFPDEGTEVSEVKGLFQGLWAARKQQSQDSQPGLSDSKPHVPTGLPVLC